MSHTVFMCMCNQLMARCPVLKQILAIYCTKFYGTSQNISVPIFQFTEECLGLAGDYIQPLNDFQTQVGGLFLFYAFYFKQPCDPRVKVSGLHF